MPPLDTATRAQIVALKGFGATTAEIHRFLNIPISTINTLFRRAIDRGYNPDAENPILLLEHVADAARDGRPRKQEQYKEEILEQVCKNRYGREQTCKQISDSLGGRISAITIWRVLKAAKFSKTKPTRKPGLTDTMKKARLEFCLRHQHWDLEDWKAVIWSDETAVVLGHRRGGYRVWRRPWERWNKSCIRERWKGYSEFMFWGCFSYNQKGPCHIWKPETPREKRDAEKHLEELNRDLEPVMQEQWELETGMRRMGLRNKGGRKPTWKWGPKTGKLTRRKDGAGVDWYRYQTQILIPKLIPFAKQCKESMPDTIVQEDRAPAHAHPAQELVFRVEDVCRMIWCGNSPDLNMIEPCWAHMKRDTTKKGAPTSRAEMEKAWLKAWEDLEQTRIQQWIERIPRHIQEVIRLQGDNCYKEGRED
jgi:transposase